ncbi:hypothetical protein [Clostridium sp.]|uniref:hypothetical protein n=1 Tax=Clostridium sp. TaxID=1506 RepID=UPI003216DD15
MQKLLYPIKEEDFREKVQIRFKSINEGFDKFKNAMLQSNDIDSAEDDIIQFMKAAFKLNGEEDSYVDFYFPVLSEEEKENLINLLSEEDRVFIKSFMKNNQGENIYFRLTEESIPFITRLSTREVLFCTIYFTKLPFTIWGNYNKKFPCFFDDDQVVKEYKDIADSCNLGII